jgi:acyl-CoA synthetase (AMP-forming)/AMP-acid ligase II
MNLWTTLERAAALWPHDRSLVEGAGSQSYVETRDRALRLALFLRQRGIVPGDRVAILAWNGIAFFEVYYAAAAIGAILVPLNVRLSAAEQTEVVCDSGAKLLVADVEFSSVVADAAARAVQGADDARWPVETLVWLRHSAAVRAASIPAHPVRASDSLRAEFDYEAAIERTAAGDALKPVTVCHDDVAHLYYTSGTTGRPKGVMLTHGNVGIHALAAIGELALAERDTWAHIAPMFHLADAWATFAITWAGGKHVFLPRFDAAAALDLLEYQRITITNLVPMMLNLMVKHSNAHVAPSRDPHDRGDARMDGKRDGSGEIGEAAGRASAGGRGEGSVRDGSVLRDWSSLRMILSGGAPIAPDVVRAILATFGCEYVQTYGMTETSPYLTLSLLKERLKALPGEEQIAYRCKTGRPFATIELKVVDEQGVEVAADERAVGEIWVRGPTVTPGYWNRPDETRAAFQDGWLKTGDLAVIDSERYVTIVDRRKDMIITGGEKVYSIEVEHALYAHPAVLECAVFGVPDELWGESVDAAVVLRPGTRASEAELCTACRERIAGYKVPRSIRFISELPRTGSGKISKQALRELFSPRAAE